MSLYSITPEQWDSLCNLAPNLTEEITDKDYDIVNKPEHYTKGGIEAIDYIEQQLGDDFYAYCEGNVHKYLHRYGYKNGLEDLHKALWYLDRLIKALNKETIDV